ncbi:MAG: DUF4097 domain-containing protein [Acidobacteria bacterium]|nr:DUF4097 domain-containing protein [Acidobacteriota bacterium]
MGKTQTSPHSDGQGWATMSGVRSLAACALTLLALSLVTSIEVSAQAKYSRTFRPRQTVNLELINHTGSVEVEGWERNEVKVSATMEQPAARFTPTESGDSLIINLERDNPNRYDLGDVNFRIQVPYESTVNVQTMQGNISIRNVRGSLVRAYISLNGDIDLTGIRATNVIAENRMGNILFDAELLRGGVYTLKSTQGELNLRINAGSGFTLTASAPHTRSINLGGFAAMGHFDWRDRRKVTGKVGDGGATIYTTNMRGTISVTPR